MKHLTPGRRSLAVFAFSLFSIFSLIPAAAHAATYTVNTAEDLLDTKAGDGVCRTQAGTCSLRAALQESNYLADKDKIILPAGRFLLTLRGHTPQGQDLGVRGGDLDVSNGVLIQGAGSGATVIDASFQEQRAFKLIGPTSGRRYEVRLQNLAIVGGIAPQGGAILAHPNTVLTLVYVRLAGNHAGVPWDDGVNINYLGGAVAFYSEFGFAELGALSITGSVFEDNTSNGGAGALFVTDTAQFGFNGDFMIPVRILNTTFRGNSANDLAGAVYARKLSLENCSFIGNSLNEGAPIGPGAVYTTDLEMHRSTFSDNSTPASGGALYLLMQDWFGVFERRALITNSTFSGNASTTQSGGALAVDYDPHAATPPSITLTHNTFAGNHSFFHAPAIFFAGGLDYIFDEPAVRLQNNLFWGNAIEGLEAWDEGQPRVIGDIYGLDFFEGNYCEAFGSLGGNFFESVEGCVAFQAHPTDHLQEDPLLGALRNNGGSVLTHLPGRDSPVIDAVPCLADPAFARDQRLVARPQRIQCDSGAVEVR